MDNRSMTEYFKDDKAKKLQAKVKKNKYLFFLVNNSDLNVIVFIIMIQERLIGSRKVVLIIDEVDGMSGGDRGGSAELASLIRKTKVKEQKKMNCFAI